MKLKHFKGVNVDVVPETVTPSKDQKLDGLFSQDELLKIVSAGQHSYPPYQQYSVQYTGLKVLGLVADNSACGYYRVMNPLEMLKRHGATVEYSSNLNMEMARHFDIIVAPRQHNKDVYDMIRALSWEGKLFVYELDDDLDHVLPTSPSWHTYNPKSKELKDINKTMRACHGLVTTTPDLGKWYYQNTQNVCVIENYIDYSFRDWKTDVSWSQQKGGSIEPFFTFKPLPKKPDKWRDKFVIGWCCGSTHASDFDVVGHEIRKYLLDNPDTVFVLYTAPDLIRKWVSKFKLPIDQLDFIHPRHFMEYPSGLWGIDVQIAPIIPCHFNIAKSFLKILESLASGAIPVASCVGPYARFHARHPDHCLLVGNNQFSYKTWTEAFDWIRDNPEKAEYIRTSGRRLVANTYSLEKNFHAWPKAWDAIKENVYSRGIIGPKKGLPKEAFASFEQIKDTDPCPTGNGLTYKESYYGAWGYCKK
jgi:glycosyltransferase involved in cell wall biosynthesis